MHRNKVRFCSVLSALVGAALSIGTAGAVMHNVDSNASTVKLRVSCTEGASPTVTLNDCFDGTEGVDDLMWWISSVRLPGPANPLLVDIGPGTFASDHFGLDCETGSQRFGYTAVFPGYVSFRGSGSKQTILSSNTSTAFTFQGCQNMVFSDLALNAVSYGYITWKRGGSSTWNNVEIDAKFRLWNESDCAPTRGLHYWLSSRLTHALSTGDGMYKAACDDSWFIGSEITGTGTGGALIDASREVHFYGSVIRVLEGGDSTSATAVYAHDGGEVHIHGTGIDMLSTGNSNFTVLRATDSSRIHADASGYNLSTGTGGTIARILDQTTSGHGIHAPYLWQAHNAPPSITSKDGADVAVVNDSSGPRFVIYNNACASKWYDVGNNACRP